MWFPTDRNMAGCDNCSFWVHDHCDEAAGTAIEFGDAVTYYCPPCRHQADAHHKLQVTPACLPAETLLACAHVKHCRQQRCMAGLSTPAPGQCLPQACRMASCCARQSTLYLGGTKHSAWIVRW